MQASHHLLTCILQPPDIQAPVNCNDCNCLRLLQVSALQSANGALSEALVQAREELRGKPGGGVQQQLEAVRPLQ